MHGQHAKPLLPFPPGCIIASLLGRHKRFLVECAVGGRNLWAHTNNTGAMLGLLRPGNRLLLSPAPNPQRKLPWTLELIGLRDVPGWVGVNTSTPNRLLAAAFAAGQLPWAQGYTHYQPEARRGGSRLDALLTGPNLPPLWVECKNVTLVEDDVAAFPDAVSVRAHKHIREMMAIRTSGERAAFFYCVQRPDGQCFAPADFIDADYSRLFYQAHALGVECYSHRALISTEGISLGETLPLLPEPYREG